MSARSRIYLNKLITNPSYNKLAKDFERFVRRLPKGELALKLAHKAEEGFKGALNGRGLQPSPSNMEVDGRGGYGSSLIFEEMGLRYLGPVDGHNLPLLISTLEFAKTCDRPIVGACAYPEGQGLRGRAEESGEVPRAGAIRYRHGGNVAG